MALRSWEVAIDTRTKICKMDIVVVVQLGISLITKRLSRFGLDKFKTNILCLRLHAS